MTVDDAELQLIARCGTDLTTGMQQLGWLVAPKQANVPDEFAFMLVRPSCSGEVTVSLRVTPEGLMVLSFLRSVNGEQAIWTDLNDGALIDAELFVQSVFMEPIWEWRREKAPIVRQESSAAPTGVWEFRFETPESQPDDSGGLAETMTEGLELARAKLLSNTPAD